MDGISRLNSSRLPGPATGLAPAVKPAGGDDASPATSSGLLHEQQVAAGRVLGSIKSQMSRLVPPQHQERSYTELTPDGLKQLANCNHLSVTDARAPDKSFYLNCIDQCPRLSSLSVRGDNPGCDLKGVVGERPGWSYVQGDKAHFLYKHEEVGSSDVSALARCLPPVPASLVPSEDPHAWVQRALNQERAQDIKGGLSKLSQHDVVSLDARGCDLNNQRLESLSGAVRALVAIDLSGSKVEGLAALQQATGLKQVLANGVCIEGGEKALFDLPDSVEHLSLANYPFTEATPISNGFLLALAQDPKLLPNLKVLDLTGRMFPADLLSNLKTLRSGLEIKPNTDKNPV